MKTGRYVILGCGHSGTTLISGLLFFNGYKMLSVPSRTYEDYYLNRLNEKIINEKDIYFKRKNINYYLDKLEKYTIGKWVLKDPLLNFLINDYDQMIEKDYKIIYIFRKPGQVIDHLFRELKLYMNEKPEEEIKNDAINQYIYSNLNVLRFLDEFNGEYLLLDYEELIELKNIDVLELFLGIRLDYSFVNKKLNRSKSIEVTKYVGQIHNELLKKKKETEKLIKTKYNTFSVNKNTNKVKYIFKKYHTKIQRKIFFTINKNRPIYLRKPYLKTINK